MPLNEQVLSAFRALRPTFTGKRPGKLGKYNDDGTPNADISAGLSSDYSWVRFNDDRAATRVKNIKVRREWGTDVWVEYNELTKEDEVREVHSILAPAVLGGDLAAAMNTPAVPANVSTPVSATDIQPLAVRPDATNGGLVVRILSGWAHGEWHDGSELLTLVPTATASKTAFVCVGIDSAGDPVQTLTANRAPTFPFYDGNGALTTTGAADIETVIAADPTTFWLWAFLLPNAVTAIDLTKQQDLRLWQNAAASSSTLTTKGDLLTRTSSAEARLAVGTDGHVLTADSSAANGIKWAAASGSSGALDLIILRDEKTQNTGGGTFTSGADRTRTLNTEAVDTGNHCSLSSNQFTLDAGTYRIYASAPAAYVRQHQAWLQNVTDATTVIVGTSEYTTQADSDATTTRSIIEGRFTIASSKAFEIQHRCAVTLANNGFGAPSNFKTEVYTIVRLEKE